MQVIILSSYTLRTNLLYHLVAKVSMHLHRTAGSIPSNATNYWQSNTSVRFKRKFRLGRKGLLKIYLLKVKVSLEFQPAINDFRLIDVIRNTNRFIFCLTLSCSTDASENVKLLHPQHFKQYCHEYCIKDKR